MKKLRYFFETLIVRGMERFIPRLPRHALLSFARFAGTLAWLADERGRLTAMENLRVAFGDAYSPKERHHIVRRCYQNFARTFADLFWLTQITHDNWQSILTHEEADPAAVEEARESGGVWVTAHLGNFELAGLGWGFLGVPMTTVAQDFKNPGLTPIFQRLRGNSGNTLIPQQAAVIRLMKVIARRGHVAMVADLSMRPSKVTTIIDCFGLKTCVTTIHAMLTQRLGTMILPSLCIPRDDGTYHLKTFGPVRATTPADIPAATQQCWDVVEKEIRQQPELWMWMYKQWRYLPGDGTDAAYPDYANPSTPFRKLIEESAAD